MTRVKIAIQVLALALVGLFATVRPAPAGVTADCAAAVTGSVWCKDTTGTTLAAPVGLNSWGGGQDKTWIANGGTLMTFLSADGGLVSESGTIGTVSGRPMPVVFGSATAIIVATSNGYVWRLNADGTCVWKAFIGRTTSGTINFTTNCADPLAAAPPQCPGDQAVGIPAISFGATDAESTVYIGTRYPVTTGVAACRTTTRNRVYALNAATGAPRWVFNAPGTGNYANADGPFQVGYIAGGIFPDVWDDYCGEPGVRNLLYVGSAAAGAQNTFWMLNAGTGALFSAMNAGGIESTPILSYNAARCERVYVGVSSSSELKALGISATACGGPVPCQLWSIGTTQPPLLDLGVIQFGANKGSIYITAGTTVRRFTDAGTSATADCTYGGSGPRTATSQPILIDDYFYVGNRNGIVAQVDRLTCAETATRSLVLDSSVGDAGLDADPAFTTPFLVIGNDAGRVARFNLPF